MATYTAETVIEDFGGFVDVFCNGVEVARCGAFNADEGWAEYLVLDDEGHFKLTESLDIVTDRVYHKLQLVRNRKGIKWP